MCVVYKKLIPIVRHPSNTVVTGYFLHCVHCVCFVSALSLSQTSLSGTDTRWALRNLTQCRKSSSCTNTFSFFKPKSQRLFYISRLGRGPRFPAPLLTLQNVTAETPETQMTLLNLLQLRVELIQDFWMCASLFQQADGKSSVWGNRRVVVTGKEPVLMWL